MIGQEVGWYPLYLFFKQRVMILDSMLSLTILELAQKTFGDNHIEALVSAGNETCTNGKELDLLSNML